MSWHCMSQVSYFAAVNALIAQCKCVSELVKVNFYLNNIVCLSYSIWSWLVLFVFSTFQWAQCMPGHYSQGNISLWAIQYEPVESVIMQHFRFSQTQWPQACVMFINNVSVATWNNCYSLFHGTHGSCVREHYWTSFIRNIHLWQCKFICWHLWITFYIWCYYDIQFISYKNVRLICLTAC